VDYNSIGEFTNPKDDLIDLLNNINSYINSNCSDLNKKITEIQNAINEETVRLEGEQKAKADRVKQVTDRIDEKLAEIDNMKKESNNYVATVANINTQNSLEALNNKIAEIQVKIDSYKDGGTNKQKFDLDKQFVETQINNLKNEENEVYKPPSTWQNINRIETTIFTTNLKLLEKAKTDRESKVTRIKAIRKLNELIPDLNDLNSTFPTTITEQSINSTSDYGEIANVLKNLNTWKNQYNSVDEAVKSYNTEYSAVKTHIDIQELDQALTTKYNNVKNKASEIEKLINSATTKQSALKNSSAYIKYFFDQAENKDKTLRYKLTPTYISYTDRAKEFNIGKLNGTSQKGADYKYYLSQGGYACVDYRGGLGDQMTCRGNIDDIRNDKSKTAWHMKVEPNAIAVGKGYCFWGKPKSPLCNRGAVLDGEKISYSFIGEGNLGPADPTITTKFMDEWYKETFTDRLINKISGITSPIVFGIPLRLGNIKKGLKSLEDDKPVSEAITQSSYYYNVDKITIELKSTYSNEWKKFTFYVIPSTVAGSFYAAEETMYYSSNNLTFINNTANFPTFNINARLNCKFLTVDNIWYLRVSNTQGGGGGGTKLRFGSDGTTKDYKARVPL
jgi:hypothetical protein